MNYWWSVLAWWSVLLSVLDQESVCDRYLIGDKYCGWFRIISHWCGQFWLDGQLCGQFGIGGQSESLSVNSMVGYWLVVISVVCFGSVVNSVFNTLIGFDRLTVLLRVWDGWSALLLFHLVNFAWIYYFSSSCFNFKKRKLDCSKNSTKNICLDW